MVHEVVMGLAAGVGVVVDVVVVVVWLWWWSMSAWRWWRCWSACVSWSRWMCCRSSVSGPMRLWCWWSCSAGASKWPLERPLERRRPWRSSTKPRSEMPTDRRSSRRAVGPRSGPMNRSKDSRRELVDFRCHRGSYQRRRSVLPAGRTRQGSPRTFHCLGRQKGAPSFRPSTCHRNVSRPEAIDCRRCRHRYQPLDTARSGRRSLRETGRIRHQGWRCRPRLVWPLRSGST